MPSKKQQPGPVDPMLRALKHGFDGTEDPDLILSMLTWLVPDEKKKEHRADLHKALEEAGFRRVLLIKTLWKIVQLGLPIRQARGDRENAAERAQWKRFATDRRTINFLRWLANEWDDVFWEHAGAGLCRAADRLEVLRRDPSQWIESWITPPDPRRARRPKGGNPYFDVKPEAKRLLGEAGYKDRTTQLRYLRLLGMEPWRGDQRF